MSSGFGINSKPRANSSAYVNSPYWDKPKEPKQLKSGHYFIKGDGEKTVGFLSADGVWQVIGDENSYTTEALNINSIELIES